MIIELLEAFLPLQGMVKVNITDNPDYEKKDLKITRKKGEEFSQIKNFTEIEKNACNLFIYLCRSCRRTNKII